MTASGSWTKMQGGIAMDGVRGLASFVYYERPEDKRNARGKRVAMNLRLAAVLAWVVIPAVLWAGDTRALRPPEGAPVALVAFEDLQCPDCADAEALLQEAVTKYRIPLVRRDFPLPMHNWSLEAHVIARYFDTKTDTKTGAKTDAKAKDTKTSPSTNGQSIPPSGFAGRMGHPGRVESYPESGTPSTTQPPSLGEEFRRWVFANQSSINKANLRGMAERFADQHGLELPGIYDPKGELKAKVMADYALGQQVGVIHTPTVYVVGLSERGAPFVETLDRAKLFAMIEQMQAAEKK